MLKNLDLVTHSSSRSRSLRAGRWECDEACSGGREGLARKVAETVSVMLPIPGTSSIAQLEENVKAASARAV